MENKYYAFISYSRKDIQDAKWIHSSLEKFHIPAKLPRPADAEPIPKPLRCFRDINDLDVMPESFVKGIENAIESSKYLVVVCSPNSAKSNADGNHYVDWEIKKYIKIHGIDYAKNHILPVIIDGEISNVMSPYPIDEKFKSFGFEVQVIDGHNFKDILEAFNKARGTKGKPTAIIAKTIKGKGVSFMENQAGWHGKAPNDEEMEKALAELV